jgi:superfamily II DNA/RNA helicase
MPAPTLSEQAEFLDYLIRSGRMADGSQAGERWIRLTREQMDMILSIQQRLERMVPHEAKIRKVVTGK